MDLIDDTNNSFCARVKSGIIALMEHKNCPLVFRSPEFLENLRVIFIVETQHLIVSLNVLALQPLDNAIIPFAVEMQYWTNGRANLFLIQPEFFFFRSFPPFFTFVMNPEGCAKLFELIDNNFVEN